MTKEPDQPSDYRKDLSVRLENICLRMMAKDRQKRHPSMHAVVAGLQEYLDKYGERSTAEPQLSQAASGESVGDAGTKRRQRIEGLIKGGDYAGAEKLLVALSRETDESLIEAAAWAAAELPQLRKIREEVRSGRQEMYNTASRLMKSHDYEQAAQLLEEYPYDLRTPKMQELLEQAEQMTFEVKRLRKEIKDLRNQGDNRSLLVAVDMLLEIKPGDRRVKELREKLTKRHAGPIVKILGKRTPAFVEKVSAGAQVMILAILLILPCSSLAYYWSDIFSMETTSRAMPQRRSVTMKMNLRRSLHQQVPRLIRGIPRRKLYLRRSFPNLSSDGLTIWWTREPDTNRRGIYQATRRNKKSRFEDVQYVLSDGRCAGVRPDGLEIVARHPSLGAISAQRARVKAEFGLVNPITALSDGPAMCFSFGPDQNSLVFQNRRLGRGLQIALRQDPSSEWQASQPLRVEGAFDDVFLSWGQLVSGGEGLIFVKSAVGNPDIEHPMYAESIDDLRFGRARRISIDGKTDWNIRCPRYNAATGQLFFTKCTGVEYKRSEATTELWVADSVPSKSEQTTNDPASRRVSGKIEIDLLDRLPAKDCSVSGKFAVRDGRLCTVDRSSWSHSAARIEFPVAPSLPYRLSMKVTRRHRDGGLGLALPSADSHFAVVLDGLYGSGLELVDGVSYQDNETLIEKSNTILPLDQEVTLAVLAHATGISVLVNQERRIVFNGDLSRLAATQSFRHPDLRTIAFRVFAADFEFSNVRLETEKIDRALPPKLTSPLSRERASAIYGPHLNELYQIAEKHGLPIRVASRRPHDHEQSVLEFGCDGKMHDNVAFSREIIPRLLMLDGPISVCPTNEATVDLDALLALAESSELVMVDLGLQKKNLEPRHLHRLAACGSLRCLGLGILEMTDPIADAAGSLPQAKSVNLLGAWYKASAFRRFVGSSSATHLSLGWNLDDAKFAALRNNNRITNLKI